VLIAMDTGTTRWRYKWRWRPPTDGSLHL